ncbi:acetate/propionate family kinase [Nocardiopsis sp. CNT312]|uniref:acetate/propionate family kinase n=1 Tax=Nocardiopsis sp. CNT312 TaxID=1137268 RepID=UPI00048E2AAD|nr:acetate/propionate family kinase [Nocardiopsis sp. CNT312]
MRVLVVNAGSSSVKLSVVEGREAVVWERSVPVRAGGWDEAAVEGALASLPEVDAVGHRVVHGGPDLVRPAVVDGGVVEYLESLVGLAPLHQEAALAGIASVGRLLPGVPAVACFDTAFHATLPREAATYAVPERWGVRRYGFHGLSHAYASRRAAEWVGGGRVVVAHLGAGASLAAVLGGRCVDTTMGFTPVEGLVMATRSGSVDPGMVVWLVEHCGMSAERVGWELEHASGLVALAGTADMRRVVEREASGDGGAGLALGVYVHRLRAQVAAMAAALGGLEVLVFTGGVGEGSARVRALAAEGLGFLGVGVDGRVNAQVEGECEVSAAGARVRTLVVRAREDVEVVRGVREALGG